MQYRRLELKVGRKRLIAALLTCGGVLLASPTWCQAEQCTAVRLDAVGGPLHLVPVADQATLDICQFVAVTDLIEAARFYENKRNSPANYLSHLSVASQYYFRRGKFERKLRTHEILTVLSDTPICTADKVQATLGQNADGFCEDARLYLNSQGVRRVAVTGTEQCRAVLDEFGRPERTSSALTSLFGVPKSLPEALAARVSAACSDSTYTLSKPQVSEIIGSRVTDFDQRVANYGRYVDSSLDAVNPMPVVVRYCANVLRDRNSTGVDPADGKWDSDLCNVGGNPDNHVWHASVVIGRRPSKGGCDYLVKNSWGSTCGGYDKRLECESGKIWVNGRDLWRNTSSVTILK